MPPRPTWAHRLQAAVVMVPFIAAGVLMLVVAVALAVAGAALAVVLIIPAVLYAAFTGLMGWGRRSWSETFGAVRRRLAGHGGGRRNVRVVRRPDAEERPGE
ncbi:MAG: hypothetical protein IBJ11_07340 [Phycisphaerales bacterium]|nr:hypothetical protein [Phycisphaerales bacterium]